AAKALAPAAAPVKLLPAATARAIELAAVSVTSLDRLLASGARLVAKAVPLPIDPAGLRDMLLGQAGLSPEISANLDLGAPSGAAVVSTGPNGATGAVMAVAARGSAEAARVLQLLGKVIETRGEVVLIENGMGGRGWLYRDGAVIVFSDDVEALARGARLAEDARHAVTEDVTAVLYPDAIARANGTDVKSALAMLMAQIQAAQAAQTPGISAHQLESFEEMVALLGDAEAVELGLAVDPGKGLTLRARLRARAASKLEAVARDTHPYELDDTLLALGKAPPAVVAASSIGGFMRGQMARQREHLAASKAKGVAAALAFHDAMQAALGGQTGFTVGFTKEAPLFAGQLAYPLKDGATAAALGDALGKLDKDAAVALLEAQVGQVPFFDWTVKKETVGKLKALHYGLALKKDVGIDQEIVKKLFGKVLDVYVTVSGTRFLTTFGREAKANLGKLAAAKPAPPTGPLVETLAATKGRDSFFHFDLGPVITLVSHAMSDKKPAKSSKENGKESAKDDKAQKKVLAELAKGEVPPIPIYGSAGGDGVGKIWSVDMTFPPTAFANAGGVIREIMKANAASQSAAR
ncbi:MAG TPA: hypothetical protein VHL80_07940, partial [Polyangia bacterium]|nr:hypothetical protein [Polyangia bacterium]